MTEQVLVTGVSGFIASHVTERLLRQGRRVRGTFRNRAKADRLVEKLASKNLQTDNLELMEADLAEDKAWQDAVRDCSYIYHIASPFPLDPPLHREALVPEAREGALRVIKYGLEAGVQRIVMTSSIAAMLGQPGRGAHKMIGEQDWSDPNWKPLGGYALSKTQAERAAWDYVRSQGAEDKFVTVNPGLVFGPDTYDNGGASLALIKLMFRGEFPMTPKLAYPVIDVRDCAAIHIKAMAMPETGGRRLIAAGQTLWMQEIANILRTAYPTAKKLPRRDMPDFLPRFMAFFDDRIKMIKPYLGIFHEVDNAYVSSLTHVLPRPAAEAVLAAADSLMVNGKIKF